MLRSVFLCCVLLATAAASEPVDVVRSTSGGAHINWSRLQIEASASAAGSGVGVRQEASEQQARRRISPAIAAASQAIDVRPGLSSEDLLDDPTLGPTLKNRVKLWAVSEARYYASGLVHLEGRLPLDLYLRPYLLQVAGPRPDSPTATMYTGLVVDARGTGASPALCPRLLDDRGDELWDGSVWRESVLDASPVAWISDPAHPVAARAGEHPLVVKVARASGASLTLGASDARAVKRHLIGSSAMNEGSVVVVIDP